MNNKYNRILVRDENGHYKYIEKNDFQNDFNKKDKSLNHMLYIFYIILVFGIIGACIFYYSEKQFFYLQDDNLNMLINSDYKIELLGRISQKDVNDFNFISSDSNIVTVNELGEVHALKNGNATIKVEPKNSILAFSRNISISVDDSLVYDLEFDNDNIVLNEGDTYKPKLSINEKYDYDIDVSWKSSNTSIASVSNTGEVKALSSGTCYITAYLDNDVSTRLKVTVIETDNKDSGKISKPKPATSGGSDEDVEEVNTTIAVQSVSLSVEKKKIYLGETTKVNYEIEPSNATNKKVTFSSNNKEILTVDKNGKVMGVGLGKANIEVKTEYGNKTAFVEIEVINRESSITGIELNKSNAYLTIGSSEVLTYKISPKDAKKRSVSWKSSNTSVVKVDNRGTITGVGKGEADITLTIDGHKAKCHVKVSNLEVESISLSTKELALEVGESSTVKYTITPSNASDKRVSWSSSNSKIASVDSSGKVTGVKAGTATITVRSVNGVSSSLKVTVKSIPVIGVSFNKKSTSIYINNTENLSYTITPSYATDKRVRFTSSNNKIVTVDNTGKIKGISEGEAVVTVTSLDGNKESSIKVLVERKIVRVQSIEFKKTSLIIHEGATSSLVAVVKPIDATNQNITYRSSNPNIVSVDSKGTVKGLSIGTAEIVAKSADGGYTAKAQVKVVEVPVDKVSLNKTRAEIPLGSTLQLLTSIEPANAKTKYNWNSNNPEVATVDSSGKVTTHALGTATITVQTTNGSKSATCNVTVTAIKVSNISFDKEEESITVGSSITLNPNIKPNNATNKTLSYSSANPKIAEVNSSGKITGISKGTTTITAKATDGSGVTATIKVKVNPVLVTKITLNKSSVILKVGKNHTIVTSITPSNASNKNVTYKSSDTSVASVNKSGVVTGKKLGVATITVEASDGSKKKANLKVVVVSNDSIIDIRKMSYRKYHANIGTYEGNSYKHMQNFAISNVGKDNEYVYLSTCSAGSYSAVSYPKPTKEQLNNLNRTIVYRTPKSNLSNPSKRTRMYLKNTGHGQGFELEPNSNIIWINAGGKTPSVSGGRWWGGSTKIMRIKYTSIGKDAKFSPIKTYSLEANGTAFGYGEPSIDLANNLISFRSGTKVYVYDYKELQNGNQKLIYSFKVNSTKVPAYSDGKNPYYQGSAIKGGYFYVFRGDPGKRAYIEAFNMLGEPIYYKDLTTIGYPTPSSSNREPEGLHIYNNRIFIGTTHSDSYSRSVFDIAYFK